MMRRSSTGYLKGINNGEQLPGVRIRDQQWAYPAPWPHAPDRNIRVGMRSYRLKTAGRPHNPGDKYVPWPCSALRLSLPRLNLLDQLRRITSDRITESSRQPCEPVRVTNNLVAPRQSRGVAERGRVRELPQDVIGDQRLPLCVVIDERLDVLLQEIGSNRHRT